MGYNSKRRPHGGWPCLATYNGQKEIDYVDMVSGGTLRAIKAAATEEERARTKSDKTLVRLVTTNLANGLIKCMPYYPSDDSRDLARVLTTAVVKIDSGRMTAAETHLRIAPFRIFIENDSRVGVCREAAEIGTPGAFMAAHFTRKHSITKEVVWSGGPGHTFFSGANLHRRPMSERLLKYVIALSPSTWHHLIRSGAHNITGYHYMIPDVKPGVLSALYKSLKEFSVPEEMNSFEEAAAHCQRYYLEVLGVLNKIDNAKVKKT